MDVAENIQLLLSKWEVASTDSNVKEQLYVLVNDLLQNNFTQLVQLLYRVDVNEKKLKLLLENNPTTDAARIITDLLLQRHVEKQELKKNNQFKNEDCNEEKW